MGPRQRPLTRRHVAADVAFVEFDCPRTWRGSCIQEAGVARVFRTQTLAQQRRRLLQMVAQTLRALAAHTGLDAEARDMVAFLILTLRQVMETVDTAASAWEKRDYWLKADQFRRDWDWARRLARALDAALQAEDWTAITQAAAELAGRVAQVRLPRRPRWGAAPWRGAWEAWRAARADADDFP